MKKEYDFSNAEQGKFHIPLEEYEKLKRDLDFYKRRDEMLRIGKKAVQEAQKRSLENGVPNVYSRNGKLYYQLPDGTITSETPKEYKE